MDEITIRFATSRDAAQLARLRLGLRSRAGFNIETDEAFLQRCEAWMTNALSLPAWYCWVAESNAVIGALWLQLIDKIPNPTSETEQLAYITNFFVAESARGKGLGSQILKDVLDWCRQQNVHTAILWPTEMSRSLYQRHGFVAPDDLFALTLGEILPAVR